MGADAVHLQSWPAGTVRWIADWRGTAPPQSSAAVWWLAIAVGGATRSAASTRRGSVRVVCRST